MVLNERVILVIGGVFQGKRRYLDARFGDRSISVISPEDLFDIPTADGPCEVVILPNIERLAAHAEDPIACIDHAIACIREHYRPNVIAMTANETGAGIVPVDRTTRAIRDRQGLLLSHVARQATEIVRVLAGVPTTIKVLVT
ncbi:MAG: bifunctional adenosylcobinamide kinase/adenosylcobinamide-phosphate guanylyltransferase [Saccharofermentanales bacterium]|jgi:adenosyl cobinamide kinase/adenosyl cobinamide phosphate guanylyltransferase